MSNSEHKIVYGVVCDEREFGHELPNDSFFKSIALQICRKYGFAWQEIKVNW